MSDQLRAAAQAAIKAWDALHGSAEYAPGIGDRMEDFEFREMQALRAAAQAPSEGARDAEIALRVCVDVAELPDRNSPEDWPEAMLVTHEELRTIVLAAIAAEAGGKEQDHG